MAGYAYSSRFLSFVRTAFVVSTILLPGVGLARVHAQGPAEMRIGLTSLVLAGEGARTDQLGGETLYRVSVYAETRPLDPAPLAQADVAKALRIEITADDDPASALTRPWRRELVPVVNPAARSQLLAWFSSARKGDVVLIQYAPGKGTTIRTNNSTAVSGAPHDLMLAFLDQWIGQRPVSEDLKRALLSRP